MQIPIHKGMVLIYTLVLVVLGVFMATVVLNVAVELSNQYDESKIESSLLGNIKTKWNLAMKYARELNHSWSGFIDTISCPQNITLSGATQRTTGVDTALRYLSWSVVCFLENAHNSQDLKIFFNPEYTDIRLAEFAGKQIMLHSGALSWVFADSENTRLDLGSTAYFSPDGIDDNFDSDEYSSFSTGSISYPDGYEDGDDLARRVAYGYILEDSGLYNILWTNSKTNNYIAKNPLNAHPRYTSLWDVSHGNLHLDIDTDYRLVLYEINKNIYDTSRELVVEKSYFWTGQIANIGYLQDDMTLSPVKNADTFNFDFQSKDYALFVENTTHSGALIYQMTGEDALTGSGIYLQALDDSDVSLFSYLGSHVLVDSEGRLTGDMFEVFGLK